MRILASDKDPGSKKREEVKNNVLDNGLAKYNFTDQMKG